MFMPTGKIGIHRILCILYNQAGHTHFILTLDGFRYSYYYYFIIFFIFFNVKIPRIFLVQFS